MTANIHAVVVRWRGGDEVRACLASLEAHGGPHLSRVVLVDSGSGDGGADELAEAFPAVKVVSLKQNLGFAHAANRGAAEGGEPLLLMLNPDTEVLPGSLEELVQGLADDPQVAAAVPLLEGRGGVLQHRWQLRRLPTVLRLASGRSGAPAFATPPDQPAAVAQPAAAAWLVRRAVWDALGGFDESFAPAWWEDVDFCARLENLSGQGSVPATGGFVVRPSARILHHGGSSVASLGDEAFFTAYYRNLLSYAARHHARELGLIRASLKLRVLANPTRRRAYSAATTGAGVRRRRAVQR